MRTTTKTTISMIGAAAAALTLVSAPSFASAHDSRYYRDHHRYETRQRSNYDSCRSHRKNGKATGAIIGAIGGGLLGNSLSHGNRTPGTLLGAGAGAYAGSQIGKGHRC